MEDKDVQYWIDISEYDLKVAECLLERGYYLYVGFMCHQSIEKMLKAIYEKNNNKTPPYTHKLDTRSSSFFLRLDGMVVA